MSKMPDRMEGFDLVEAFHLSHAVTTLHNLGLFTALNKPSTAEELSATLDLDADLLRGILEYVAARTNLLRQKGGRFVATRNYSGGVRFLLDLYIGAYGRNAAQLSKLLRKPALAPKAVNRAFHARAFDAVDGSAFGALPAIVRQLEFNHVLDLGCGNGSLLLELAGHDSNFVGWGIDFNRAMCRTARARIRDARLGKRLHVIEGDCRNLRSQLPPSTKNLVRAVTACNIVNEMFTEGDGQVVTWLQDLRKTLPGRILLIADYYGRLGVKKARRERGFRETILHDYIQLISGQGVPPSSHLEWQSIYSRAKCRLVHMIEDKKTTRFIHLIQLSEEL